jgi:hypothetical protein
VDTRRIHRNTESGERGMIEIQSFSDSKKSYLVSLDTPRSCECKHHSATGARCRHILAASVIQRIRRSKLATSRDEEVAREIVSRVLDRTNRLDASYEALSDARSFRFGTKELVEVAHERHRENIRRELAKIERGAA